MVIAKDAWIVLDKDASSLIIKRNYNQLGIGRFFSFKKLGFHNFEKYRAPESHRIVTIVFPGPNSFANLIAPATLIALEPPKRSPS